MKLPRDIPGVELAKKLTVLGYEISRQNGSHIRLSTMSIQTLFPYTNHPNYDH